MEDMWRTRAKPTPLDFDAINNGTFTLPQTAVLPNGAASHPTTNGNASTASTSTNGTASHPAAGLKDQKALTLRDNVELFVARLVPILYGFSPWTHMDT